MHLTNLQLVILLFIASNFTVYLVGRWHGLRAMKNRLGETVCAHPLPCPQHVEQRRRS